MSEQAVVIYSARGRLALALAQNRHSEALLALQARLAARRYTVLSALPPEALDGWAHPTTPTRALLMARQILCGTTSQEEGAA